MNYDAQDANGQSTSFKEFLSYDDRFLSVASVVIAWAAVVLFTNLLRIGGHSFILGLNTFTGGIAAIIATSYAYKVRNLLQADSISSHTWAFIMTGLGFWALIEIVHFVYLVLLHNPVSHLLIWLWIPGYIPFIYSLYRRYRYITSPLQNQQRWIIGVVGVFTILVIVFKTWAVLKTDISNLAGILFTVIYSLANLGMLILALRIHFSYKDSYSWAWLFITIGFALKLIGETIMAAISSNYAAIGASTISFSFATFAHFHWYLAIFMGAFTYEILMERQNAPSPILIVKEENAPNASALIFTDQANKVIKVSLNYRYLMHLPNEIEPKGMPLQQVLGLSQNIYHEFETLLYKNKTVKNLVVEPSYLGKGQKAWITAGAAFDMLKKYNGANIVVRFISEGTAGALLNNEERALAESILATAGSEGEDKFKLLINYFNISYKMLLTMALATAEEGTGIASGLSEVVNHTADKNKWSVHVLNRELMVTGNVKIEDLGKATSTLLTAARGYVIGLVGPEIVRRETDRLNQQMDHSTRTMIEQFRLDRI